MVKQKNKINMKLFKLITLILLLSISSCEQEEMNGTVKYKVKSSPGGFDVTYENGNGGTSQRTVNSDSWSTSFHADEGDWVYLSAQSDNKNAKIEVKIEYNGDVLEKSYSNGDYVVATASGDVK